MELPEMELPEMELPEMELPEMELPRPRRVHRVETWIRSYPSLRVVDGYDWSGCGEHIGGRTHRIHS